MARAAATSPASRCCTTTLRSPTSICWHTTPKTSSSSMGDRSAVELPRTWRNHTGRACSSSRRHREPERDCPSTLPCCTGRTAQISSTHRPVLGDVACPVYLFHGTSDDLIPHRASELLAALVRTEHQLITIVGAGHNDLGNFEQYGQQLDRI